MLANTLNTNEIKNSAGAEVEFQRLSTGDRRSEFGLITEQPSFPYRMIISHQESGSGLTKRRRSVIRFDKSSVGGVDNLKTIRDSAYIVLDRQIGNETGNTMAADLLANLMSFCATTGAATTVLFDGTGTGASNLLSGGI